MTLIIIALAVISAINVPVIIRTRDKPALFVFAGLLIITFSLSALIYYEVHIPSPISEIDFFFQRIGISYK